MKGNINKINFNKHFCPVNLICIFITEETDANLQNGKLGHYHEEQIFLIFHNGMNNTDAEKNQ